MTLSEIKAAGLCCGNCCNTDPDKFEDNGCRRDDPDWTILCVRRVRPEDSDEVCPEIGDDGLTICGNQWMPNQEW